MKFLKKVAKMVPRALERALRGARDLLKGPPAGLEGAKSAPEAPKNIPRGLRNLKKLQDASKRPRGTDVDPFWEAAGPPEAMKRLEHNCTRTPKQSSKKRAVAGTVFASGKPRVIQVKNINMEAELTPSMLYVTNEDKPGHIGRLGTLLGKLGINIANFNLGRAEEGSDAIALVSIDGALTEAQLAYNATR